MFLTDDTAVHQRFLMAFTGLRGVSEEEARRTVILGGTDEAKGQIQALADVGVQEVYIALFTIDREAIERFSTDVIPAFAD